MEVEEVCAAEGYWVLNYLFYFFSFLEEVLGSVFRSKHTLQLTFEGDESLGSTACGLAFMETTSH